MNGVRILVLCEGCEKTLVRQGVRYCDGCKAIHADPATREATIFQVKNRLADERNRAYGVGKYARQEMGVAVFGDPSCSAAITADMQPDPLSCAEVWKLRLLLLSCGSLTVAGLFAAWWYGRLALGWLLQRGWI